MYVSKLRENIAEPVMDHKVSHVIGRGGAQIHKRKPVAAVVAKQAGGRIDRQ